MGFLSKFSKGKNNDDDDYLDLDDDELDIDDDEDEDEDDGGKSGGGLFGKFGGKRNKNEDEDDEDEDEDYDEDEDDEDEDENDEDDLGEDEDEDDSDEDDSKVQRVQVEGVTDVRPMGESGGLAKKSDDSDAESSDDSDDGKSGAKDGKNKSAEPSGELDLNSLFAEEEEVDELLKDLADSEEEVNVDDLAAELQAFLSELEKRTAK